MRYREIDVFKGILVVLMVYAHCVQFFILRAGGDRMAYLMSDYINLTTFSGFMFAFGVVCWHAYINRPFKRVYKRLGINIVKTMMAFYVSSFAYIIFIARVPAMGFPLTDILLVRRLAGWSEFILSFAVTMLLVLVFHKPMQMAKQWLPYIIAAVAVVATVIPLYVTDPFLATFVGRPPFATFAVLPYGIFFAGGIWVAQGGVQFSKALLGIGIVGFVYFAAVYATGGGLPSRFPVSLAWLAGSMIFVYAYYLLSLTMTKSPLGVFLQNIGSHSLFYLVMSNIFIFAVTGMGFPAPTHTFTMAAFILLMVIIYYLSGLCSKKYVKNS